MAGLDKQVVLDNYENNFLHEMNAMRKRNVHCDVRFIIKGKEFPCHKIMLMVNAARDTDYFQTMFTSNFRESASETIPLQEIEPEAMDEILTAIYTSQFHLNSSNAYYILRASHLMSLTVIFNKVVSCIMENLKIDFLVETCLFAEIAEQEDLHLKCIAAIAANLNDISEVDSFYEKITFEHFKMILKHEKLIKDKEALFQIVKRWCNQNESTEDEVLLLLNAANLRSGCLNAQAMAQFIVCSYNATSNKISSPTNESENTKRIFLFGEDQSISYNVYLNTVDVKSGAKGWATLESKLESNEYSFRFITYQRSNPSYKKLKKVGTTLYCFEYNQESGQNTFWRLRNGKQTHLPIPRRLSTSIKYYDIAAVDNSIYIITGRGEFAKYDCQTNSWLDLTISGLTLPSQYYGYDYRNEASRYSSPKLSFSNGKLFVVGVWEKEPFSVVLNERIYAQYLGNCPRKFRNPAVCCYDNKMVMCGSDHDDNLHKIVSVYDMAAQKWFSLEDMNIGRANHTLNYHNGFLYAIENKPMVPNEKYDIKLNKWTCIPPLPRRLNFTPGNLTLATGSVFGCNIE